MSDTPSSKRSDQVAVELEAARVEHGKWVERLTNYDGNNPTKFQAPLRAAAQEVKRLKGLLRYLRERGE